MAESAAHLVDQIIPQVLVSIGIECRLHIKSKYRIGSILLKKSLTQAVITRRLKIGRSASSTSDASLTWRNVSSTAPL